MLKNYLAAALRNLIRNKLYAAIGICGLAVGVSAALSAALVLRHELSYEHFISGYRDVYLVVSELIPQGRAPDFNPATHSSVAALLKAQFVEVSAVTRLADQSVEFRRNETHAKETIYWADPDVFDVLPLPVYAGELRNALRQPDALVLTRGAARKYFGRDNAVGETLQVNGEHTMTVTAVIQDLPAGRTQLQSSFFASGVSSYSELSRLDSAPARAAGDVGFQISVLTFVRLKSGSTVERMRQRMPELMNRLWPRRPPGLGASMDVLRIDRVHLFPPFNPGAHSRLSGTTVIGALILILASVNFVNLATARSARRALEVSIRKAAGADRSTIAFQFLGESFIHVLLATCIAVALTEWVIPYINAFLDTNVTFEYWHQPGLLAAILVGALVLTLLAGWYPAVVISAFHPAVTLRGVLTQSPSAGILWKSLIILQFAILTGLMIAAGVVYQQQIYATHNALRVNTDQLLVVESMCNSALRDELQRLPGVRGVACSAQSILSGRVFDNIRLQDGNALAIGLVSVDAGTLEMYGLEPLAGRFFRAESTGESSASPPTTPNALHYIVNESAVRGLGLTSPAAAIGQPLRLSESRGEIIGVVRDFSLDSIRQRITPALYLVEPRDFGLMTLKLSGQQIPESLAAIDRLWLKSGATEPIKRYFVNDYIQNLYRGVLREAQAFGIFSVIAVLLAALGLFGLSASITERRTKEISIRKAMGAGTFDVMRLLVWQFTKPVLWANLLAWPVSAYLMSRWLHGFAYRVELSPWLFIAATLLGLAIAQITVAAHCYSVARSSPVIGLRST